MTDLHLLFPAGFDDPAQPSGGNAYDTQLAQGLARRGWTVVRHDVAGAWPAAGAQVADLVAAELRGLPDGALVLVDGLVAAGAPALLEQASRLRLAALVHMPGPPGGPPTELLHAVRLVVTTSAWTAQALMKQSGLPADRVVAAPPGVVPADLAPGTEAGGRLVCVAPVTEDKGYDVLFRALAGLADRDWSLECAGSLTADPEFLARQERALSDTGIADRVRFAGTLTTAELDRMYATADLLVLATRSESYGMVVTEALARGLPVVASDVGGVPEALGRGPGGGVPGLLVPPGDASALGAAVRDWLDQPPLRQQLRSWAAARRLMLEGWDRTVASVDGALRSVAG